MKRLVVGMLVGVGLSLGIEASALTMVRSGGSAFLKAGLRMKTIAQQHPVATIGCALVVAMPFAGKWGMKAKRTRDVNSTFRDFNKYVTSSPVYQSHLALRGAQQGLDDARKALETFKTKNAEKLKAEDDEALVDSEIDVNTLPTHSQLRVLEAACEKARAKHESADQAHKKNWVTGLQFQAYNYDAGSQPGVDAKQPDNPAQKAVEDAERALKTHQDLMENSGMVAPQEALDLADKLAQLEASLEAAKAAALASQKAQ